MKNFILKYKVTIGILVLAITFGVGYWVLGNPGPTTIGEDIDVGGQLCLGGVCRSNWSEGGSSYRMAACNNSCSTTGPNSCTANCTATCPLGYTIVSSCKGSFTYFSNNMFADEAGAIAASRCDLATPGPCTGTECTATVTVSGGGLMDRGAGARAVVLCEN